MVALMQITLADLIKPEPLRASPELILSQIKCMDAEKLRQALRAIDYRTVFLKTPYWWAVSTTIKNNADHRCQLCNRNGELHTHHRSYDHHGEEHLFLGDLICLCDRCHTKFHGKEEKPAPVPIIVKTVTHPRSIKKQKPSKFFRRAAMAFGISAEKLVELGQRAVNEMYWQRNQERCERSLPKPAIPKVEISIPTCAPEEMVTLTTADVRALRTVNNSFTAFTVEALGFKWGHMEAGWPARLVGATMPRAQFLRAFAGTKIYNRDRRALKRGAAVQVLVPSP